MATTIIEGGHGVWEIPAPRRGDPDGIRINYFLPPSQQKRALSLLAKSAKQLARAEGPTTVSLLTDVGRPRAAAAVGQLTPTDVFKFAAALAKHRATTTTVLRGLTYVGLNFGRDNS